MKQHMNLEDLEYCKTEEGNSREGWFDEGVRRGAKYVLVCDDRIDKESYPIFIGPEKDIKDAIKLHDDFIEPIVEVFDLNKDKQEQLSQEACWSAPPLNECYRTEPTLRQVSFALFSLLFFAMCVSVPVLAYILSQQP